MKRNFKIPGRLKTKSFVPVWIIFHLLAASFFLIRLISNNGKIGIDSDLFNITPKNFDSAPLQKADEKLTASTGNNIFILISNPDFEKAKEAARTVYENLDGQEYFTSVSLYNDISSYSDVTDFLFKYRWNLLDEKSIDLINSEGGAETFSQNAAATAFGFFTLSSMENIERDPFMLSESNLTNYLNALQNSGTAMSVKDGMLVSNNEGIWYIMLRCTLSKKGTAMATKDNAVNAVYAACSALEKDGTQFIYSGTPYHTNESSSAASKEITIISIASFLIVIILLIAVFRTPVPIFCSLASIGISVITAFLFTSAAFSKVMILTLVFGTTLIGSCIDYSLHYFMQWAGNPELKNQIEIRNHLLPGLSMAIISSCLCYAILLFAPFELLKQISLFSLTGLLSSFLTTICIYPALPLPKGKRELKIKSLYAQKKESSKRKPVTRIIVASLFIFSISAIIICRNHIGIENNISKLYTMKGRLLHDETLAAKIIQYSPTGWFIIQGETEDEALSNEEKFRKTLENASGGNIKYLSTTLFIPSVESQKKSRKACERLLELSEEQYALLGFPEEYADSLRKDFYDSEGDFISFENGNIPHSLFDSISMVHLGEINGKFYTVLVPNMVSDENAFYGLSSLDENVWFSSKRTDINKSLDSLTKMVLIFFAVTYLLMFIILNFFYSLKQALKIISIPLLITLMVQAVFAVLKTKLEFFSVTGLILVFGLGLDYIIYMIENEKNKAKSTRKLEPFTTLISFVTTVISFGSIALSSFPPVHFMGLAISIGLTVAFTASKCYDRS